MELGLCYLQPATAQRADRGDLVAVVKRCLWRGIDVRLIETTPEDPPDFRRYDLIFIGGSGDADRHFLIRDLRWLRQSSLVDAVEMGVVVLALAGAYPLMGRYYQGHRRTVEGLGLLDLWTEVDDRQLRGQVAVKVDLPDLSTHLIGRENHRGRTWLGPRAQPLGHVLAGSGNNGQDGTEGAVYMNLFGSYLKGPVLPRNPEFLDYLIQLALERKYQQTFYLPPLPNLLEDRAHQALVRRLHLGAEQSSPPSAL